MSRPVPDEYFRSDERSSDTAETPPTPPADEPRLPSGKEVASRQTRQRRRPPGVSLQLLTACAVVMVLLGVVLGRFLAVLPDPQISEEPSASPVESPSPVPSMIPYDGSVRLVWPDRVMGECQAGTGHDVPGHLIDGDPDTIWRCAGSGVGATLTFVFDSETQIVGVRMVNGNTVGDDRFLLERRIVSVRWDFPDGSWLMQGLAASDPNAQELRIPPITVQGPVTLTVQASTIAGDPSPIYDAVSISSLDFLTGV